MKQFFANTKSYIVLHRKAFEIGGILTVLGLIVIAIVVALIVHNTPPKIVYQPTKACDLLTLTEAKTLLGDKAVNGNNPDIIASDNLASSSCTYSDLNADQTVVNVAAVNIRYAINDAGITENKSEFTSGKPSGVQDVSGFGDKAYYNATNGQLNILDNDGKRWMIVSYGVGSSPQNNTLAGDETLAKLVLN